MDLQFFGWDLKSASVSFWFEIKEEIFFKLIQNLLESLSNSKFDLYRSDRMVSSNRFINHNWQLEHARSNSHFVDFRLVFILYWISNNFTFSVDQHNYLGLPKLLHCLLGRTAEKEKGEETQRRYWDDAESGKKQRQCL